MLLHRLDGSVFRVRILCDLLGYLSSIYVNVVLLGGIWKSGSFGSTYFTLGYFLFFYYVGVNVCLFCCWGILHLSGYIDSSLVAAFAAVLSYLSVGFGIEIFWLDCRYISHIAWHMWVYLIIASLLLLMWLVFGYVAHVSDDGTFFRAGCEHD